jgi:hypothetical protein
VATVEKSREYYLANKDAIQARNKRYRERNNIPHKLYSMVRSAKLRSKEHNLPFNITTEDLKYVEVCPLLGIPLDWEVGNKNRKITPNSPSLDRIIPELGYVKGNIMIISYRANVIKHNATVAELQELTKNLTLIMDRSNDH